MDLVDCTALVHQIIFFLLQGQVAVSTVTPALGSSVDAVELVSYILVERVADFPADRQEQAAESVDEGVLVDAEGRRLLLERKENTLAVYLCPIDYRYIMGSAMFSPVLFHLRRSKNLAPA